MSNPLVSLLIPAFNRPHLLTIAIKSAAAQSYPNIEIIICDDSTNLDVYHIMDPLLEQHANLKYVKNRNNLYTGNIHKLLSLASGEFVNFLFDDDVLHPRKIEEMMDYMYAYSNVSLVTSYRQTIDIQGNLFPDSEITLPIFKKPTLIEGRALGDFMLSQNRNIIGEPTAVLFRKSALTEPFGTYAGIEYIWHNDVASWLTLLNNGNAVYLPQPLSYIRNHDGQYSKNDPTPFNHEWYDFIRTAHKSGYYLQNSDVYHASLYCSNKT